MNANVEEFVPQKNKISCPECHGLGWSVPADNMFEHRKCYICLGGKANFPFNHLIDQKMRTSYLCNNCQLTGKIN